MLVVLTLVTSVLAIGNIYQSPSIGKDCTSGTPVFKVSSFYVNPWPITNQLTVNVTVNGVLSTPTFIYEVWISSSSLGYFYNQQVVISQQYPSGSISLQYVYNVEYPAGNWNVILTTRDVSFNILNCWSFQYSSQMDKLS